LLKCGFDSLLSKPTTRSYVPLGYVYVFIRSMHPQSSEYHYPKVFQIPPSYPIVTAAVP
jgi:hypothetical protein